MSRAGSLLPVSHSGRPALRTWPVLCALLALGCSGQDKNCTLRGCAPSFRLDLENPIVAPGTYDVSVVADGQSMTCPFVVPPADPIPCSAPITMHGTWSNGGRYADNLATVWVPGTPSQVDLTITRESTVLLSESFTPRYEGVEFNGPGCGECPFAVETVRP